MSKIKLVIAQEYKNKVSKKSFLVITILMPILFVGLIVGAVFLASLKDKNIKNIAVIDNTGIYHSVLTKTSQFNFDFVSTPLDTLKKNFNDSEYESIIVISDDLIAAPNSITIYSTRQINKDLRNYVEKNLDTYLSTQKLLSYNIPDIEQIIEDSKSNIRINTIKWADDGTEEASSTEVAMIIGMLFTFLIYFFILAYGSQVMSSVVQEKANRIVEVLICSVKPFELMMGKIISIALVGLTQFAIWIVLTIVLIFIAGQFLDGSIDADSMQQVQQVAEAQTTLSNDMSFDGIIEAIMSTNPFMMILMFIIYFLGGYLLYSSIFAAIGSAVDNETDTNQFMMPITILIIAAFYAGIYSVENPDGPLAFWCSLIPFTSPIVMMVRLPFSVPVWQQLLSITLLIATFIGTTWMSAKIYRTGILMYGKKPSWKELWKWLRY